MSWRQRKTRAILAQLATVRRLHDPLDPMIRGPHRRSRTARLCARVAVASVVGGWSSPAWSAPSLQGVADTAFGYTDNLESSPSTPVAGIPAKAPGIFALLSPSLVLAVSARRSSHRVAYTFTYILVFNNLAENSSANRLDYQGFFDLAPTQSLLLDADIVQSNTDTATGLGQGALLPGATSYVTGTMDQLFSMDLTSRWRAWEAAELFAQAPLSAGEDPETESVAGRVGADYAWKSDALGAEARSSYTVIQNSLQLDGAPAGPQEQLTNVAVAQFRQDLSRHFTASVEGGAMQVARLNTQTVFWSPAGAAAVNYTDDAGALSLTYDHAMTTNPLLGQYLLVDEARLGGALPLVRQPGIILTATAGYQLGQLLDQNANLAAHVDTLLVDVGIQYLVTETLALGVRYQHIERWSDVLLPPLPFSFTRNTGMLTATFKYPPDARMPRPYRSPVRVDRTDEVRDAPGSAASP